jgi:hypothetical protein
MLDARTDPEQCAQRLHSALGHLPRDLRFAVLVSCIIEDTTPNSATTAIAALVSFAALMAMQLRPALRADIARHMQIEAGSILPREVALGPLLHVN